MISFGSLAPFTNPCKALHTSIDHKPASCGEHGKGLVLYSNAGSISHKP